VGVPRGGGGGVRLARRAEPDDDRCGWDTIRPTEARRRRGHGGEEYIVRASDFEFVLGWSRLHIDMMQVSSRQCRCC
jgi:hypothetical protein